MYSAMIAGHTMMLRKEFLEKLFALGDWMGYYMYDHFISIVAGAYEKISYIQKVLVDQRKHIDSATYAPPLNYERSLANILGAARRTYRQYQEIHPKMEEYFKHTYELLRAIPADTPSRANGMRLAYYQSAPSLANRVRLTLLCARLRDRLFFSQEKGQLFSLFRALYFPISCSDYFRYWCEEQK